VSYYALLVPETSTKPSHLEAAEFPRKYHWIFCHRETC